MSEQVGSLQIDIDLKTKNLLVSQRQAEAALDDIGNKIGGAERQAAKLNTQLTKTSHLLFHTRSAGVLSDRERHPLLLLSFPDERHGI